MLNRAVTVAAFLEALGCDVRMKLYRRIIPTDRVAFTGQTAAATDEFTNVVVPTAGGSHVLAGIDVGVFVIIRFFRCLGDRVVVIVAEPLVPWRLRLCAV